MSAPRQQNGESTSVGKLASNGQHDIESKKGGVPLKGRRRLRSEYRSQPLRSPSRSWTVAVAGSLQQHLASLL